MMGCKRRVEDCVMHVVGCDWEDVLVTDPFYARMDQRTNVVTFVESDSVTMSNEEEEERYHGILHRVGGTSSRLGYHVDHFDEVVPAAGCQVGGEEGCDGEAGRCGGFGAYSLES